MDEAQMLHSYLPDVQDSLGEIYNCVECTIEGSPELAEPPFNLSYHSLGTKVILRPAGNPLPQGFHVVKTCSEGEIITDGLQRETLHLILEGGTDWRAPLQQSFNKHIGADWAFLVLELIRGTANFHVLTAQTKPRNEWSECVVLWLVPMKNECFQKPKLVRKIVKKSPEKIINGTNGTIAPKATKSLSGTKVVRKKLVPNGTVPSAEAPATPALKKVEKTVKSTKDAMRVTDGSADSGISLTDSDNEKSLKTEERNSISETAAEFLTPCGTPDPLKGPILTDGLCNEDLSASLTLPFPSSATTVKRDDKMEKILEEEEKQRKQEPVLSSELKEKRNRSLPPLPDTVRRKTRRTPPTDSKLTSIREVGLYTRRESETFKRVKGSGDQHDIPVQALRLVLRTLSYKELARIRSVHPHWDELCGQCLNDAYCHLIKKADKLLTDCQRRIHVERDLQDVLSFLTNLQVHILNPVDVLRPAIDEGICCFPYGELLDKAYDLISKAEKAMKNKSELDADWKPVAELARRAKVHYKRFIENAMEEKLGEVIQLKALQSIQRIDSFMIDSTVTKLEKAAHMARDEIEWEIEQLRQQNSQLKKDNREIRKDYMRLDARVESLENKLKTMARLLQ